MIERQGLRQAPGIDDLRFPGVVGRAGSSSGPGDEDRRDRVLPGVSAGVRVTVELAHELDVERSLLFGLAHRGRLERLSVFDKAAGQGPAERRILAADKDDAPPPRRRRDLDDEIDCGQGIARL